MCFKETFPPEREFYLLVVCFGAIMGLNVPLLRLLAPSLRPHLWGLGGAQLCPHCLSPSQEVPQLRWLLCLERKATESDNQNETQQNLIFSRGIKINR